MLIHVLERLHHVGYCLASRTPTEQGVVLRTAVHKLPLPPSHQLDDGLRRLNYHGQLASSNAAIPALTSGVPHVTSASSSDLPSSYCSASPHAKPLELPPPDPQPSTQ